MAQAEGDTGGVVDQGAPGVASAARRLLKDSGRYLLAGVKAALSGAQTPATFVVDAWRQGHNELRLDRVSLSQLLNVCLARQTAGCAEKGVDLLLEHGEPLPEARLDSGRLEAVLEVMLDTARQASAQNRAVRVRCMLDGGAKITVLADIEGDAPQVVEGSSLGIVREMARAHGGELVAERLPNAAEGGTRDGPFALCLTLPMSDVLGLG